MSERKMMKDWVISEPEPINRPETLLKKVRLQARKEALEEAAELVRRNGTFGFLTRPDDILKLLEKA